MSLYVELVPSDLSNFIKTAKEVMLYKDVTGINVPDILRLTTSSYDAVYALLQQGIPAIPHIRSIDHPIEKTIAIVDTLVQNGLKDILLITGDPPPNPLQRIYEVSPLDLSHALRIQFPGLKIYGALDPYRSSFRKELSYVQKKASSGMAGLFTQPIFDPNLAKIYLEQCKDHALYIGISPVITESSYNYWITRNKAIFPANFNFSLDYNSTLGKTIIQLAQNANQHVYLMPIKVPIIDYLDGLFKN